MQDQLKYHIAGYVLNDRIYESSQSVIYKGKNLNDNNRPVILKFPRTDQTRNSADKIEFEFNLLKKMNIPGTIMPSSLETFGNSKAMVMEDFDFITLYDHLREKRMNVLDFLESAVKITGIVSQIHKNNIVHKDIKPQNILLNRETGEFKIIDFSISSIVKRESNQAVNANKLEGTLAYMSPEQTGRVNHSVDFRSDFYSLGITFYLMLTGKLPFNYSDPMEMVHAHIARTPFRPSDINPDIPEILSDIVMKLISKNPEGRYQSSEGLKHDLTKCLESYKRSSSIESFTLGEKDVSDIFRIPEKLYGRLEYLNILNSELELSSIPGAGSRLVFVSGEPGIGKTSLINEIQKPLAEKNGYFISGKYELFRKDTPFSGIIAAFNILIDMIISENESEILVWRDKILCGIGDNASVMVNIFPQLRLIIGDRPVAPELPPAERERRFNFVFQSFIRVFAGEDHPLVLFLDDLQNVDRPSLNCLEIILNDAMLKNFMFIGSFRSNEVAGIHPLKSFMAGLEKENIKWKKINLLPLSGKDINSLVSATLLREDTGKLAESIVNKTGGNPFFVNEFLKTLYENGWITYSGGWQYDIKTIESTKITDNIVELMVEKIKRVPAMTLELLKTASCTGNKFYFDTLSQLFNRTEFETMEILKPAIDEGMIIKIGNTARFSHDRVQEAVFSLTTEHERLKNHYLLGKALLENTLPDQKENRLFTIIGHLNYAVSIISDPHERLILAWMNLAAGIKAKSSTAYEQACLFFDTGIMLLPENPWKNEYRLTLALYSEGGEAMYLAGKNQGAEEYFETVLTNAVEPLDKVKIYSIQVPLHTENSRRDKAIELGRKALALLGVNLPEKSNPFILIIELMKASRMVKRLVKNKNADSLLELPHVSDHVKLAVSQILMSITTPAYISNPDYYPLIALKLLNYTLKNGNSAYSAFAYVVYGLILISTFGKYDAGFQFGRLALKLGEIIDTKSVQSKVNFLFGNLINHWKRPIRENIPFLENGYRAGMETGDIQFASYCINHMLGNLIVSGENLEIVKDRASEFSSVMKKIMQVDTQQYFNMFYQIVISLIKNTGTLSSIKGDLFDEDLIVPELQKTKNLTVLGFYTFWKEYLCYLYGDYEGCIGFAAEGNNYLDSISGMPYYKEYFYYQALALLGALPAAGKKQSNVYLRIVKNNLKKIRKWAIQCPENCLHKQFFIEAEINAVSGRKDIAMKLYDSAVETAHRNGFINEEAMILERASVFYDQEGMEKVSSVYLKEAFSAYKIWGAGAKLRQLFEKHPDILPSPEAIEETAGKSESSSESSTVLAPLDLSSVMKAASAISGEIKMDKLLGRLVKIAMENAGAQKTVIVLFWKGVLNVEAVGNSGSDEIERPYNANIDESLVVPASIIRYVARKKQSIVIDDAYHESAYSRDEYIHDNRVRSVLCQPIVNKGLVIGVIYMENNLSTGAFTKERLQIMNILSGQMGISIDNAGLYDKLESYSKNLEIMVEERTLQLKEVNRELSRRYETMARELRVAHTIQQAIIPDVFPEIPWLSLAGRYIPMEELGGDFYDLFYLDKNIVSIIIADVSGHGVPAALITAMAKISFNSNAVKGKSAGDTIELVNRELCKAIEELMQYLSAFYCIIDMDKKELEYCNAGHVEIMLQRDEKTIIELPPNSPVIGYKTDYEFNSTSVKIMPGDRLVLFTDGIPEARDDESKFYGMDRFIKTLQKNRRQTPEIMVDNIFKDIGDFTMKSPARDDITLLVADILDKN